MANIFSKLVYLINSNDELDSLVEKERAKLEKERNRKRYLILDLCALHAGTSFGVSPHNCDYCKLAAKLEEVMRYNPPLPINLRGYRVPKIYY